MERVDYDLLPETEVVDRAREDDGDALEYLLNKYKGMVRLRARAYYLIGADREDLIQEGMIGLYRAICDFDKDKQVSFKSFADICVTRQLITAIKAATRQKHRPLNSYVSLNKAAYDEDDSERTLLDTVAGDETTQNPEDIMIDREDFSETEARIQKILSDFEHQVLELYIAGKSYQEIAAMLERSPKSIDNALQRTKAKLEKHLEGNGK